MFKFSKAASQKRAESRANACTGHDSFVRPPVPEKKVKHLMKKLHKQNGLKRSNSAIEFDVSALSAASRRHLYSSNRSASSEQDYSDQSEHSEKSPLVSARLDNLARLFFSKSMPAETGSRDTIESVLTTRPNLKYQYSALDSGNGVIERSPRERANRERALNAVQEWIQNPNGRYEVLAHLDEIGSRHGKHWFLVTDSSVRTDRLLTLLPLPPDCIAFENLQIDETPQSMLMELLGSLHHPYIYPVLDLGFLRSNSANYACLVTPFNSRGSLKDLIYKAQWNEPWARKYTKKPSGLPISQVQRLGRQILEALLFLKERGFPLHGHLHSGNVILQNGAARLSGLENGLLGLSSRINAVMWSRSTTEIENVDIICFGHLLYEMCTGQEMTTPKPSIRVLEMELEHLPQYLQIIDVLGLIFEPPSGVCPTVEDLVLCDLFRSIDLRELRGPCFSTIKPSLSRSTLNLLHAVKKRQCASLGNSMSEMSSPCTPPSTPRERTRSGASRTMDSFDISSDSEEGLLDEVIVGSNYRNEHLQQMQCLRNHHQQHSHPAYKQYQPVDAQQTASSSTSVPHTQFLQGSTPLRVSGQAQLSKHTPQPSSQYCDGSMGSPIHYCDNTTHSDDNAESSLSNEANTTMSVGQAELEVLDTMLNNERTPITPVTPATPTTPSPSPTLTPRSSKSNSSTGNTTASNLQASISNTAAAGASFNHQLTADMCSYKNSKSRRLEYSLKCLKYGRSNPSQDSAFGSLTDNDLSIGSSSFRISSFQSISSPIDEGVEDIIIATTTAGKETCLELATIPRHMISQDSAISSPCREMSPSNFLTIDDATSATSGSSSSGSSGSNVRPHQFPASLSPKIYVTTTTNSSNSSLASINGGSQSQSQSQQQQQQQQQFDPPKILVNDQNSIYTTSPSKRSSTIEVFSQKYRVSSFEDMSPGKRSSTNESCSSKHIKNANRLAFRSLEEERRIDSAFTPIIDRTNSDNRVNMQSEKYKKLTHTSFRISKTSSQVIYDMDHLHSTSPDSSAMIMSTTNVAEMQRPATAVGSVSSRQAMWRDSKFYRKNHIAKSNDSLLELSPNHSHHSARLTPTSSLRDTRYEMGLTLSTNFFDDLGPSGRRYCSSKSEDLGETTNDYLRVMDARKSYSERHLVALTTLKQTAINNTVSPDERSCCVSEDELSFNDDNNLHGYLYRPQQSPCMVHTQCNYPQEQQQQLPPRSSQIPIQDDVYNTNQPQSIARPKLTNIKTTSLATLSCHSSAANGYAKLSQSSLSPSSASASAGTIRLCNAKFKSLDQALNVTCSHYSNGVEVGVNVDKVADIPSTDGVNSSTETSPSHQILNATELTRIFAMAEAQGRGCNEEKTPLLDSVELSPISPTERELDQCNHN